MTEPLTQKQVVAEVFEFFVPGKDTVTPALCKYVVGMLSLGADDALEQITALIAKRRQLIGSLKESAQRRAAEEAQRVGKWAAVSALGTDEAMGAMRAVAAVPYAATEANDHDQPITLVEMVTAVTAYNDKRGVYEMRSAVDKYRDIFTVMDRDQSGGCSPEEIQLLLKSLGRGTPPALTQRVSEQGEMTLREFIYFVVSH